MPNGTWLRTSVPGSWNVATDWVSSIIASGPGFTANLTSNLTAAFSVRVPAGYAVSIGNIVLSDGGADGFRRYIDGGGSSNTQTAGTLTLDSGSATQPVINTIQECYINGLTTRARFVLAGTNGFNKTGNQSLIIDQANGLGHTISGTITVSGGSLYLGIPGSSVSATNALPSATQFVVNGGGLYLAGPGSYTESKPFSCGATLSTIGNYASGTITFNNTAWRTFTGYAQVICDANSGTTVTSNFLSHFPAAAAGILGQSNISNSTATMIFSHDYAVVYPNPVGLYASAATSGGKFVLQDNGTASTNYQGTAYRWEGSNTSSSMALDLSGTNTQTTYSGRIRNNTGTAAGTLLLIKSGAGTWTLSGNNDYTGSSSISAGLLKLRSSTALGAASSAAVTQTGGTIDISGNLNINKAGSTLTLISSGGANAIQVPASGGNNTLTCAGITLASTAIIDTASSTSLTLSNSSAMSGAGYGITKNSAGELNLGSTANTYTGAVTVNAGTLTIGTSALTSTASPLGNSSSVVSLNGTLKYNGLSNATIGRTVGLNSATPALDASGSGTVEVTSLSHVLTSAKTLSLKGSNGSGNNILSSNLGDSTGATSLSKEDTCTWKLTGGTVNYTGNTTVTGGTLDLGGANRTLSGNISVSGGTLSNGSSSNTLDAGTVSLSDGTLRANLTGSGKSLLVTGGDNTVYPTAGANSFSGASSVYQGATLSLKTDTSPATAGAGKVLGDANVTVLGEVKTGGSATQKGQVRWGGNLSLGLNSKIHIGAA